MNPSKNLLLLSCGLVAASSLSAQHGERPNVILLVADDLGYGDLSCYGATRVHTPAVDSLARHGVRFTDMHACASTSTPSRYGILTGQYPFRLQGTDVAPGDAGMIIRPERFTLADLFRSAGYKTAAIGKWHLGLGDKTGEQDWNATLPVTPADIGFDYHYLMAATADRVPCVWIENGRVCNWDESAPIQVSYSHNFDGEPTGRDNPELLRLRSSHGHDQSIVNGIGRIGFMKGGGRALWRDEDIADSIVAHAVRFVEENREQPFFIYLCTNDVHVPRYPHERFRGRSEMGLRGEAVMQFDWTVNQLCDALARLQLDKNTLLIITSDNGPVLDDGYADRAWELAGSHNPSGPYRGGKYSAYEGGTAVPYIVYWPGHVPAGRVSEALTSHIDLGRSLAQLLDQDVPADALPDSRPLLRTMIGKSRRDADFVVGMPNNRSLTLRQGRWKLIPPSEGPEEAWQTHIELGYGSAPRLYDIRRYRYEGEDVADRYPEQTKRMMQILQNLAQ